MFFMSIFDLTTGAKTQLPMLPASGSFSIEQGQASQINPILGAYPNIQIGAVNARIFKTQLDLWGPEGAAFYNEFILPSYGLEEGLPHLLQIAWGTTADAAFTGRPIGMPPTEFQMGGNTGEIFARVFELTLTEINNAAPRVVSVATGQVVSSGSRSYQTAAGDDLFLIAQRNNTTVEKIAALNGGNPAFVPPPGTRLILPRE